VRSSGGLAALKRRAGSGTIPISFCIAGQGGTAPAMPMLQSYSNFNRHREPPDQLGEFVQMFGIMIFNGLREPPQTFIVAEQRDIAGHDRGCGLHKMGLGVGHLVTFLANPASRSFRVECVGLAVNSRQRQFANLFNAAAPCGFRGEKAANRRRRAVSCPGSGSR
jgi:hypothetical protein